MTETPPENHYRLHADTELDTEAMEAQAAEAEQGYDMDQAVRHNVYIGWVLGIAKANNIGLMYLGGNQFTLDGMPTGVKLVIPYPPDDWKP